MKFGLSPTEYDYLLKNIVEPLEKTGAKIWCYGSRARGDHTNFSDVDLMVESDQNLALGGYREILEKSNFPYKVDLVWLGDFVDSFRPGFDRDKVSFR